MYHYDGYISVFLEYNDLRLSLQDLSKLKSKRIANQESSGLINDQPYFSFFSFLSFSFFSFSSNCFLIPSTFSLNSLVTSSDLN